MKNINGKKFLSDLKLHSDYFKWLEKLNRYETWEEACEDIINGHKEKHPVISKELDECLEQMKQMRILASQRSLQFRNKQIKRNNCRMFNCSVIHACTVDVFKNTLYLGLSGCGVGVSLLKPFVNCLPSIQKRKEKTITYTIDDSIEGWSDALNELVCSFFYGKEKIRFDYSQIREEGSYIDGGFKAPGPNGLKKSLEIIENLFGSLLQNGQNKLNPINVFDIICHASDAVLSGGVRRSALNMIVDPNDEDMIYAKTGNWRSINPQRARSNNSVLILRKDNDKTFFDKIVGLNSGDNDIGFVFGNTWFDIFNPCFEIGFTPVDTNEDLTSIEYKDLENWCLKNINKFGVEFCNLNEINAEKCQTENEFYTACKTASILGTVQASYTNFPYLGKVSESLCNRESLLGVSITGWMNNPKLFDEELLQNGARLVVETNKEISQKIGINQAARTTCVKPSGNASVVLMTASGIHSEHSETYFRVMQLNKNSEIAKWLNENMPELLEESVWSSSKTDYVVFVPIINPKNGLFKDQTKGVKHLKLIQMVQKNWILPGTNPELGICNKTTHNCSCTVIIDNKQEVIDYIWNNKDDFTAISFISDYGDKDFNQAPFTSVLSVESIFEKYGKGSIFVSGLIVDGLHYFDNNLWEACDFLLDKDLKITGTREQVLLKKYWINRAKKFAKNYFKNDLKTLVYCLKDVHLCHKWDVVSRVMKDVDFNKILKAPEYKSISDYSAVACSGNSCEITKI
jgi:ribonucleoside-triphosphate reductase